MSFTRRRRPLAEEEKSTDAAKARAKALEIIALQELCSAELYARLCRSFTEPAAAYAVGEMVELDYVNDARYAENRAAALLRARKSRRAAAEDMRKKGLDDRQIQDALDAVYAPGADGENPETAAAAALVSTHYSQKLADGRRDLVIGALMRRGFTYRVACEAVRKAEEEMRE